MSLREPRRSRALLAAWLLALFAASATTDPRLLGAGWALALLALRRGAARHLRRALLAAAPLTGAVTLATWVLARLAGRPAPGWEPLLALNLRAALAAFLTLAVLSRVEPFRALAPWPWLGRVLSVSLAQIHALRLVATDSLLGLRSRLPRRPRARDVVAGAGAVTGTLFTLTSRNARDVADALRARGF